jgi:hypothetical protein
MKLRAGEWVEVRSKEEILATLDKDGRMEGLPFMPQMFLYCGQRFKVYKRAHKTCDFVYTMHSRELANGVHLDLRCDGKAYGGCQHACLLYWKDAWLKHLEGGAGLSENKPILSNGVGCTEADVYAGTNSLNEKNEPIFTCQGTDVLEFTKPLAWWDIRQYIEDYRSGNVPLIRLFNGFVFGLYSGVTNSGLKVGRPLKWLYDAFEFIWGPYPRRQGKLLPGEPPPTIDLNLQPGELVRVRSYNEILSTLNKESKHKGLFFDAEMVPYCGKVFRVRAVISTFIDEKTRKLVTVKTRCVALEGVVCQAKYAACRMLCPRSILPWWREVWLERVPNGTEGTEVPKSVETVPSARLTKAYTA